MSDRSLRLAAALCIASGLVSGCSDSSAPTRVRAGDIEIAASVSPRELRVGKSRVFGAAAASQNQAIRILSSRHDACHFDMIAAVA